MKIKMKNRIRQFMAMFLCILMISKLVVPTLATVVATDSNASANVEHVVLNTGENVGETESTGNSMGSNPSSATSSNTSKASSSDASKATSSDADQIINTENGPQVGDEIWIRSGSKVYKEIGSENGHKLIFSYKVKIIKILLDDENQPEWYEFEFTEPGVVTFILRNYKYVHVENTSVTEPDHTQTTEEKIVETMDSFVETVDKLPEADAVKDFYEAETDYVEIHELADRDSALPKDETEKYGAAYRLFAIAMGYDGDTVEVSYPGTDLTEKLKEGVGEALDYLDEAEDLYDSLEDTSEVAVFALEEDTQKKSVVDLDEKYAAAKTKLDAILEAKPDLLDNEAEVVDNTDHKVASVSENIQMHLFNYGPAINTQQTGQGYMRFTHSEGEYGWAVDSQGDLPLEKPTGHATLLTTLYTERFPYISEDTDHNQPAGQAKRIRTGTLQYLFDPTYTTGRINYTTYKNNISSRSDGNSSPYNYHSIYFPIDNTDGSGTGLFQKNGDYFVYDSAKNAAWYNPETQKFEIYDYVLRPAYTVYKINDPISTGNFLPFNQGHTQGREDYQAETKTKEYTYNGKTYYPTVSRSTTNSTKPANAEVTAYRLWGSGSRTEVDLWFGMNFEFDFYQPEGGQKNNQDMVFEFLGDDDVFVYIDDVLILDIGGTHAAQSGTINFKTGAVQNPSGYGQYGSAGKTNSTIYELMKAALGDQLDDSLFVDSNGDNKPDTFKDYTKHNLKFYYLERGGNISYCSLKFNMDPLAVDTVTLQKQVNVTNTAFTDFVKSESYEFEIKAKDAGGNSIHSLTYQIDNGSTRTVGDGGTISLKANEKAVFKNVAYGTEISFKEKSNSKTSNVAWTLNGTTVNANSDGCVSTTVGSGGASADFVCTNTRKTEFLTVKKVLKGDPFQTDDQYEITVKIGGKLYSGNAEKMGANNTESGVTIQNGKISLKSGEKITIPGIPTGMSYEVFETSPATTSKAYTYDQPKYQIGNNSSKTECNGTISDSGNDVTVINTLHLLYGDLTVEKSGISDTDHSPENGEVQSTIYRIYGTSYSGTYVDMQVVIKGNASVVVKHLPVGTYTVEEMTDWSWRYDPVNGSATVEVTKDGAETAFVNTRTEEHWLSGDSYCSNWWGGESGSVTRRDGSNRTSGNKR